MYVESFDLTDMQSKSEATDWKYARVCAGPDPSIQGWAPVDVHHMLRTERLPASGVTTLASDRRKRGRRQDQVTGTVSNDMLSHRPKRTKAHV